MNMSRWLTWTPSAKKFENSTKVEPTKLTKTASESTSVSFVSPPPSIFQNFCGGEVAPRVFPHCPRCASYALYRRNNIGNYECQTCGLRDITEVVARRIQ
jgi:hypothetical protein